VQLAVLAVRAALHEYRKVLEIERWEPGVENAKAASGDVPAQQVSPILYNPELASIPFGC